MACSMNKNEESNFTLIINYMGMQIGGIEGYLAKLMEHSLKNCYRVIWLTNQVCDNESCYKNITNHPKVEKIYIKSGYHWEYNVKIAFHAQEKITMFSCEPLHFLRGENLRKKYKNVKSFSHYLVLPHFTGCAYYPERFFKFKFIHRFYFSYMKHIATKLNNFNCIRAFALKHLENYEKNYNISIRNKTDKILASVKEPIYHSEDFWENKADERKRIFNIVTCARFDFPHKGYLVGLIDCYKLLKLKHSQIKLTIVGYGNGQALLEKKISELPFEIRKDIDLQGALTNEELREQFCEGHLNVGLAGALADGAYCGLPSLLVRHYTYDCETYGQISDIQGTLLKTEKGENLIPFVEKFINMTNEEYIYNCKKDYLFVQNLKTYNPNYIFEQCNSEEQLFFSKKELKRAKILNFFCYIKQKFFGVKSYDDIKDEECR